MKLTRREIQKLILERMSQASENIHDELFAYLVSGGSKAENLEDFATRTYEPSIAGGGGQAADPAARAGLADSVDRKLKQLWNKLANRNFINSFTIAHSVNAMRNATAPETFDDLYNFIQQYGKTRSKHELSCVGYNDRKTLDQIIKRPEFDTALVKIDGWVTFATCKDNLSQWLGKKAAQNIDKMRDSGFIKRAFLPHAIDSLISDEGDEVLCGNWNEFLVDNWKLDGTIIITNTHLKALIEIVSNMKKPDDPGYIDDEGKRSVWANKTLAKGKHASERLIGMLGSGTSVNPYTGEASLGKTIMAFYRMTSAGSKVFGEKFKIEVLETGEDVTAVLMELKVTLDDYFRQVKKRIGSEDSAGVVDISDDRVMRFWESMRTQTGNSPIILSKFLAIAKLSTRDSIRSSRPSVAPGIKNQKVFPYGATREVYEKASEDLEGFAKLVDSAKIGDIASIDDVESDFVLLPYENFLRGFSRSLGGPIQSPEGLWIGFKGEKAEVVKEDNYLSVFAHLLERLMLGNVSQPDKLRVFIRQEFQGSSLEKGDLARIYGVVDDVVGGVWVPLGSLRRTTSDIAAIRKMKEIIEQQPALDARAVNIAVSNPQDVRHLMDDDWTMKDHGDLVTKHFQSDTNESLIRDIIREFIVLH